MWLMPIWNGLVSSDMLLRTVSACQHRPYICKSSARSSTVPYQSYFNMGILLFSPLAAAVIVILYNVITHARQAAKAKALGCQPAPLFRAWDVFGVQNFKIEMNGMKTNRLSYAFLDRKKEMSAKIGRDCKTFRIKYPPGETWYYTFDPKNLQAVLATQFQDFQQPAARVGAFQALLGPGIVRFAT
jgi:hypothetical protein